MPGHRGAEQGDPSQGGSLAEELRTRLHQQAIIADLGLDALAGADLQSLMDRAVVEVAGSLEVDYCKVLELLPDGENLLLRAGVGWREGLVGSATVGTDLDSQAGYTLKSSEPVIVRDLASEDRFRGPALLVEHGVVSGMSVVIHRPGGVFGVLGTHARHARTFSRHDVHFIQAIANVLGQAVERKRGEEARTRAEEALQRAKDELEERVEERTTELSDAIRELESFSYAVSHDLRAPLRSIDGFARALQEDFGDGLDEAARRYLERITAGSQNMSRLIDDLLNLSRLTHGPLRPAVVDLSALARRMAVQLGEREPERDVTVEISDGMTVRGDEQLLGILLTNLLDNAWKFTRGEVDARIRVGSRRQDGETVYFVADNGAGFNMRYANKLFVPFQRLHANEVEGTGIGLATVQRIVHRHGGRLWAEGTEGEGASFFFTIGDPEKRTIQQVPASITDQA